MRTFPAIAALLAVMILCSIHSPAQANDQTRTGSPPNVLVFVIDDLGRCDIGIDGATFYETPYLDALARSGVRMSNFYSASPVCSPTRAALMTGKVPQRLGITDWIHPSSGVVLPATETTLAEAFRNHGYQTGYVGKWHLGEDDANLPTKHGFDWTKGVNRGGHPSSYYFPFKRPDGKSPGMDVPDFENGKETDYLTDVLTSSAIEFLKHRDPKRPFLLCCGHYAIHTPIQPPKDLPEKYRDKSAVKFGQTSTPTISAPNNAISRGRQDDANYAAMMENLDTNIGRVLTTLDELGERKNTIVVFTSDNGGLCTLSGPKSGPTCNLPFRSGKGWTYEGGIRISTFISWPEHLKPSICDVPGYSADLYPTLLELCQLPSLPNQHKDGRSLVSALRGVPNTELVDRSLAWYYPHEHGSGHKPSAAIRKGNWKLIISLIGDKSELYDLAIDVSEKTDLSLVHPDQTKALKDELLRWISDTTN